MTIEPGYGIIYPQANREGLPSLKPIRRPVLCAPAVCVGEERTTIRGRTQRTNGCGFCLQSRAPPRGFAAPSWAPAPPPLRAGGGWVIPLKKLQRKEQTSRKRTTRTRSPYPFPRTPYGSGEGEQTKELRQIEQTAVTGAPEPDTARLFVQNQYFVSVKTRCKQTALTPFVYRLFCAGTPRHLARGNLSFRSK